MPDMTKPGQADHCSAVLLRSLSGLWRGTPISRSPVLGAIENAEVTPKAPASAASITGD